MSLSILIVDDDRFTRKKVSAMLEGQGFHVHATDDWAEITRIVATRHIDVILMDVEMPDLTGDRLAKVILKTVAEPPKILLHSSLDAAVLDQKAREIGAQGYITKGLPAEEYAERIEASITGKAASFEGGHLGFGTGKPPA